MGKFQPYDGKQTTWAGLWWHPEVNGFSSEVLNLATIRQFKGNVRLYMRKNKFFNSGENGRPNYCFCLRSTSAEKDEPWEVEGMDAEPEERLYTRKEVQDLMNDVRDYVIDSISRWYDIDLSEYSCEVTPH